MCRGGNRLNVNARRLLLVSSIAPVFAAAARISVTPTLSTILWQSRVGLNADIVAMLNRLPPGRLLFPAFRCVQRIILPPPLTGICGLLATRFIRCAVLFGGGYKFRSTHLSAESLFAGVGGISGKGTALGRALL